MNAMMLSCVKATELMEMKEYIPAGVIRTMQLTMHVAMCSGCKNYMKQTKLINKLLNRSLNALPEVVNTTELEQQIITRLTTF